MLPTSGLLATCGPLQAGQLTTRRLENDAAGIAQAGFRVSFTDLHDDLGGSRASAAYCTGEPTRTRNGAGHRDAYARTTLPTTAHVTPQALNLLPVGVFLVVGAHVDTKC